MKQLFFLILLVNFVFFLWQLRFGEQQNSLVRQSTKLSGKQIVLVAETASQKQLKAVTKDTQADIKAIQNRKGRAKPTAADNLAKPKNSESSYSCFRVGPFTNQGLAQEWTDSMTVNSAVKAEIIDRNIQQNIRYLVYYPAADSFETSLKNLTMLRKHGIKELWLFRNGELRGNISLGIFNQEDRAELVRDKHKKQNLDLRVKQLVKQKINFVIKTASTDIALTDMKKLASDLNLVDRQIKALETCKS